MSSIGIDSCSPAQTIDQRCEKLIVHTAKMHGSKNKKGLPHPTNKNSFVTLIFPLQLGSVFTVLLHFQHFCMLSQEEVFVLRANLGKNSSIRLPEADACVGYVVSCWNDENSLPHRVLNTTSTRDRDGWWLSAQITGCSSAFFQVFLRNCSRKTLQWFCSVLTF